VLGETIPQRLEIVLDGKWLFRQLFPELSAAYEGALESRCGLIPRLVAAD
jgi:hypothetical protein